MRKIKKIVVHVTDSDDSLDIGFREINQWHKERGWLSPSGISCGYHYIVRRDGRIEHGRPEEEAGAHVAGHNSNTLGVVWVGRKQIGIKQEKMLMELVRALALKHEVDLMDVVGHFELNSGKSCPNLDMNRFRAELAFVIPELIDSKVKEAIGDAVSCGIS